MSNQERPSELSYGSPMWEYLNWKKIKEADIGAEEVGLNDLLFAVLRSADSLFQEMRAIRRALEKTSP